MTLSPMDNDLEQSAFVLFNLRDSCCPVIKTVSSFAQIGAGLDLSGSGRSRAGKETKMDGNFTDTPEDAGADDLGFEWMEGEAVLVPFPELQHPLSSGHGG
ncbi:hypothetical protein ACFX11_036620 [Malus domestica]